jgi:hypothetical protein
VFVARPPSGPPRHGDLHLVRGARRTFTGPAQFLADPANRARVSEYLADMARPYGRDVPAALFGEPPSSALGHSYGEMAEQLVSEVVPADEHVSLLVLAFSIHDLRPGRPTAAYLSAVTPGTPMAFAICDQGPAAAFTGLRIAREYASSAGIRRALVIVVEQSALPYGCPVAVPSQHRGVAMLLGDCATPRATLTDLRQLPGVASAGVADLAAAELKDLADGRPDVRLLLSDALGAVWPAPQARQLRVMPAGQPCTEIWSGLLDELSRDQGRDQGRDPGRPDLLVVADYDPDLRYLCLAAFDTPQRAG